MKKKGFDKRATDILKDWMLSDEHVEYPYPNEQERMHLSEKTGMSIRQVLNWFVNARKRIWQPLLLNLGYDVKRIVSERKQLNFHAQVQNKPLSKIENKKRKGHWSTEEEKYAETLIYGFLNGLLTIKKGTALRTFLANRLNCHPMRISKKFAKQSKLGKSYYIPRQAPTPEYLESLLQLEGQFNMRLEKEQLVERKTAALQEKMFQKEPTIGTIDNELINDYLLDWTVDWDDWLNIN